MRNACDLDSKINCIRYVVVKVNLWMFCYQITRTDMVVLYWNWHLSAFLELFWKNKKDVWGVFRPKPSKNFLRQMSQMRSCLPVWNIMDCPNAVLPLSIPFLSPCQQHHMQTICTSLQSDNHTNTLLLNFTGRMLFLTCQPTVSKHWRLYANVAEFQNVCCRVTLSWKLQGQW